MASRTDRSRRRTFLQTVTACGAAACLPALAAETPRLLTENDRIDIGGKGKEIIDNAYRAGREYMEKYGNCAQSALGAIQDSVPFVPKDELVFLASTPLSGGATRTRNASCGAFTGCGLAIGSVCGRSRANYTAKGAAPLPGQLLLQVHDNFVSTYGNVICTDIRTKVGGKCADVVGKAAAWCAEALLKQFTNYKA
ncbi:MAG: C_GCAxxG_C_C family protein [Acidobacteriales bacterium]|nr:MAG: C_GCAxxG_C_C family protein [Terriglobales bacterium]